MKVIDYKYQGNSPVPGQSREFGVRCGGARPPPGGRHIAASRGAARTRGRRRRRVARDGTRGASERVRGRRRDG